MTDIISVRNLEIFARHGVYKEERKLGQRFEVDLDIETDFSAAALSDKPTDTIDYSAVIREVKEAFHSRAFGLIEALANHIAMTLLAKFPKAQAISITVRKPHAAIDAVFDHVAVSLRRARHG